MMTLKLVRSSIKAGIDKIKKYIEIGKEEGKLLTGGSELTEGKYESGYYLNPTLFTDVKPTHVLPKKKFFGPVLSIIPSGKL